MESLYLLIPLSIATIFVAIWVFFRASDSGQFDDLVGPAMRVVQDNDRTDGEAAGNEDAVPGGHDRAGHATEFSSEDI